MTFNTVDTADTESLPVDDLHVVEPRAAGLDVHKMCITRRRGEAGLSINAEGMAPALATIEWYEEHNNGSCRAATGCWPRPPRAWRKEQLVTTWEGKTMIVVDIRRKVPPGDAFYDWYRK